MIGHRTEDRDWDDIAFHEALFETFASHYLEEHPEAMPRLKQEHAYKVLCHARAIVHHEGPFKPEEGRAALLAAPYHDVGRFPQDVRWQLPSALREPYLKITSAVRDADKLDIMRIMAFHSFAACPHGRKSAACPGRA